MPLQRLPSRSHPSLTNSSSSNGNSFYVKNEQIKMEKIEELKKRIKSLQLDVKKKASNPELLSHPSRGDLLTGTDPIKTFSA